MTYDLKKILLVTAASLLVIRFWIEVVTTTVLKNSNFIISINNSSWFHHYQLGIILVLASIIWKKFSDKDFIASDFLLAFGLALFIDQYLFVLSVIGMKLPFVYRSTTDYVVISFIVAFFAIYSFLGKKS